MPELPEVETVRRTLAPLITGARVERVWTSGLPLRLRRPVDERALRRACEGKRITAVRRRAKYLLLDFQGGATVLVHLGMTGWMNVAKAGEPREKHTHVVWELGRRRGELRFTDARRFGYVGVLRESSPELAVLGQDPLEPAFTAELLAGLAQGVKRDLKSFLMDQSRVAGLGNIYVSEALHVAALHPRARAGKLRGEKAARLRDAIVEVLEKSLGNRGTTLRDYKDAAGDEGGNQDFLLVYDREGQACLRCKGRIRRVVQGGRSTFYCSKCQKM